MRLTFRYDGDAIAVNWKMPLPHQGDRVHIEYEDHDIVVDRTLFHWNGDQQEVVIEGHMDR